MEISSDTSNPDIPKTSVHGTLPSFRPEVPLYSTAANPGKSGIPGCTDTGEGPPEGTDMKGASADGG